MSTIKFDTWKRGDGTYEYAPCTVWVNYNSSGTPSIRDSLNVSSLTDNGVGDITVNFTTALLDNNFSTVVNDNGATGGDTKTGTYTVSSVPVFTFSTSDVAIDRSRVSLVIFGGV